jgi:hypothetical protein
MAALKLVDNAANRARVTQALGRLVGRDLAAGAEGTRCARPGGYFYWKACT